MSEKYNLLKKHLFLFMLACVFQNVLDIFLFFRKTPYNLPYVIDISHYFFHAIFYSWYGLALISLPFLLFSIFFEKNRKGILLISLHVFFLFISLFLSQVDHELLRFMGFHLSLDFLATYGKSSGIPAAIWDILREDNGGRYSSLILGFLPFLFLLTAFFIKNRNFSLKMRFRLKVFFLFVLAVVVLILPFIFRLDCFGGKNRQAKVAPPIILLKTDISSLMISETDFSSIETDINVVRKLWKTGDSNDLWKFTEKKPLEKEYVGEKTETNTVKPNFIIISFETFRAWNIPLFNQSAETNPTPFLSSLAVSENGGYWKRFISNGQPTIYTFMALHTGLPPHSSKTVAKAFTSNSIDSYASILCRYGYYAAFFGASDPDWDNQRLWLNKWYDYVYYKPENNEQDRLVLRDMAEHLKKKGEEKTPFVYTTFMISNHLPFDSREPELDLYHDDKLSHKIYNTMHYDDDAFKEFFNSIKNESWFKNTVFIITGDHGYDLGERGVSEGHTNVRHETNWVPLIIYSALFDKKNGVHTEPASHMDIIPTIMEMAGIYENNSFLGHSLFNKENRFSFNIKLNNIGYENEKYSLFIPEGGKIHVYDASDLMQKDDLKEYDKSAVGKMIKSAESISRTIDYIYEKNLM